MYTIQKTKQHIVKKINNVAVERRLIASLRRRDIVTPPNPAMGDFSFACFDLAKTTGQNPTTVAVEIAAALKPDAIIQEVRAVGPYVNFFLRADKLATGVLSEIDAKNYGSTQAGKGKKIIVEYACPNVNKAFHIGHLRNIIIGESIIRLLAHTGYKVVRANYQGDVGMHIAKSIWGIVQDKKTFSAVAKKSLTERITFLGAAYARGAQAYEDNEAAKVEINELNRHIYENNKVVMPVWKKARGWSLQYFEHIYKRLGSTFDYYFFESEVAARGVAIVQAGVKQGIFRESDGAIIFSGSEHGLHDRVFINSAGFPTYEAKDLALAEVSFKKIKPALAVHVVGKEQTEYFKVVFKALEYTLPQSKDKEVHVSYGWVHLKGGKMSSRLGNVVTAEDLLAVVKGEVAVLAHGDNTPDDRTLERITIAAVKYAMLKGDAEKDISFDMQESISLSGNSGPYLLYTYARIQSILRKAKTQENKKTKKQDESTAGNDEKQLLFKVALFPEIVEQAAATYNPALVAKHAFELAQAFNDYYHRVPVLKADADDRALRLAVISAVAVVLKQACYLLGFETVEKM